MKNYWLFLIILFASCQNSNQVENPDLVVTVQTDTIQGCSEDNSSYQAAFNVDTPVNGPQVLVDSVMVFLNKKMYDFCEGCVHEPSITVDERKLMSFRSEEVFTNDAEHFLEDYLKKYRPVIQDSLWVGLLGLELKVEAQAKTFVTYAYVDNASGASSSSRKYYYVFDKSDGHIVKEIISGEKLRLFCKDYHSTHSPQEDGFLNLPEWENDEEHIFENTDFGLGADHLSIVVSDVGNHYDLVEIPYSLILSYLTPEAQTLVKMIGEVASSKDMPASREPIRYR